MNKKAISPFTIVFWLIGAIVVYVMFASEQIKYWGLQAVANNGLTGIEAFAYSNVNFMVYCIGLIFIVVLMYASGD